MHASSVVLIYLSARFKTKDFLFSLQKQQQNVNQTLMTIRRRGKFSVSWLSSRRYSQTHEKREGNDCRKTRSPHCPGDMTAYWLLVSISASVWPPAPTRRQYQTWQARGDSAELNWGCSYLLHGLLIHLGVAVAKWTMKSTLFTCYRSTVRWSTASIVLSRSFIQSHVSTTCSERCPLSDNAINVMYLEDKQIKYTEKKEAYSK